MNTDRKQWLIAEEIVHSEKDDPMKAVADRTSATIAASMLGQPKRMAPKQDTT
jgi:hypothetical protein